MFFNDDSDSEIRDENEGSIITSIISQLRCVAPQHPPVRMLTRSRSVGMDLSRVTFPTFVLEPRSMLERITDFMSHPDLIFGQVHITDQLKLLSHCSTVRTKWIVPKSVLLEFYSITCRDGTSSLRELRNRKFDQCAAWYRLPTTDLCRYNPILGECFRCRYDYPNGRQGFYIAEQGMLLISWYQ